MPENIEVICIEIKKPRIKLFLVSSWYRAPDLNVEIFHYFEIFLCKAEQENKDVIITVDLICNLFSTEENTQTKKLRNIMHMYQLSQNITTPTRITSNSKSLIDIIQKIGIAIFGVKPFELNPFRVKLLHALYRRGLNSKSVNDLSIRVKPRHLVDVNK
jgi:hypothetical protein